jgi:spore coat polysaccharide biosynthesis protein SpsF
MSVLLIVQARVGSSRLPGKVLELIEGVPLLTHVLRRARAANFPQHHVLAIPDTPENDPLVAIGEAEGFRVYRGSETDVLSRFWWASQLFPEANPIVRITADDYAKDPALIDLACELFIIEWATPQQEKKVDPPHYLHLGGIFWALGMDVEVFSRGSLDIAYRSAVLPEEREHVTPYIRRQFGVWTLKDPQERANINTRLTIDTPEDLERARAIYAMLYAKDPLFGYDAVLSTGVK